MSFRSVVDIWMHLIERMNDNCVTNRITNISLFVYAIKVCLFGWGACYKKKKPDEILSQIVIYPGTLFSNMKLE